MSKIWFGTRERFTRVACPAYNASTSHEGWSASGAFLDGGGWVKNSPTAHMVYEFEWNLADQESIRQVTDYASSIHGLGPVYFYLPGVMDTNALPEYLAAPSLGISGGAVLNTSQVVTRQTTPTVFRDDNGLPVYGAAYTVSGGAAKPFVLPVPPGYTAVLDVWGRSTGGASLMVNGVSSPLTTTNSRVRSSATGEFSLSVSGSGSVHIFGMVLRIVTNDKVATLPVSNWTSGRGHSGCRFVSRPQINTYSSALDLYGSSARLIETGAWE